MVTRDRPERGSDEGRQMPLPEHEHRILEEIEERLKEEDPHFVQRASLPLSAHLARRIRWATLAFCAGFIMLWLFILPARVALAGFVGMLRSGLIVYHFPKRLVPRQI